jgi:23S rRNA pseudouridine1911/1915/1917 synthase
MEVLQIGEIFDTKRLDVALASHKKVSSRAEAQRIIKSGTLLVNQSSNKISPDRIVKKGDIIKFALLPRPATDLIAVPGNLNIVFEDHHLIVVNKPSGMVVHPSAGHYSDTLVNYLIYHTQLPDNDPVRPGIVHRIDKDTSGLLVIAKTLHAHEHLAKQFFHHTVSRKYQAIAWGIPDRKSGVIDKPLGRHPSDRKKFAVRNGGKKAITHWRIIKELKYLSLMMCRLETGRTHQIRIHMSSMGHSLLGDAVYGKYRNYGNKLAPSIVKLLKQYPGQALHAKHLGFYHPDNDEWMEFESDLPVEMQEVINELSED